MVGIKQRQLVQGIVPKFPTKNTLFYGSMHADPNILLYWPY